MVTFTMLAELERHWSPSGLEQDGLEVAYPIAEVTYRYWPGRPAYTPRGEFGPIDPPDPAEVELVGVKLISGDGMPHPEYGQLREWAEEWLESDAGFRLACQHAEHGDD